MRNLPRLAAVIIGAAVMLPACGRQHPGTMGVAVTPPAGSTTAGAGCPNGLSVTAGRALHVNAHSNGQSFCVRRGTAVLVYLQGTLAHKWTPIHVSSSALMPSPNAHLQPTPGVTGASLMAAHPGTAIVTSVRPVCGSQPPEVSTSRPGTAQCETILTFRVSVTVTKLAEG